MPSKDGESSKIKVKVRLDIHGVLNVVNASLVEKIASIPEPETEKMEVEGQEDKSKETSGDDASKVQNSTKENTSHASIASFFSEKCLPCIHYFAQNKQKWKKSIFLLTAIY